MQGQISIRPNTLAMESQDQGNKIIARQSQTGEFPPYTRELVSSPCRTNHDAAGDAGLDGQAFD